VRRRGRSSSSRRWNSIPVVFDAAHAFGASIDETPVGCFGDAEVFSLTPTKVLVRRRRRSSSATNDSALAEVLRAGRDYGNPVD
jgi:dTDP-4-amino-4,6-dideoxygalactose transaminase